MKENIKYLISLSGGKDSTACLLWALENLPKDDLIPYYIDTKWEHEDVYAYLEYLESSLDIKIIRLESDGMVELSKKKKMIPNPMMRFCTENLKIKPALDFYKALDFDFINIVGIRREESETRKNTQVFYISREGIKTLCPIVDWTTRQVFDYIKSKNIKVNPLYLKGFDRVGCYPCIYARKHEIQMMEPKYKKRVMELEKEITKINGKPVKFFHPAKSKHMRDTLPFDLGCINQYGQCE